MKETVILKNQHFEVERFQRHLEERLKNEGFTEDLVHDLSLVTEELLVNTVSYGYPSAHDDGTIEVTLSIDDSRNVTMTFRDDAQAFNPLTAQERDPDDERLGGWGIPMIKTLTDKVSYQREENHNVLTIERAERDS